MFKRVTTSEMYPDYKEIPNYSQFIEDYYSFFGFEDQISFDSWIQELVTNTGYTPQEITCFIDDFIDNPKIKFNDGTIWSIEGNYGQDYLVDVTDNYIDASKNLNSKEAIESSVTYYDPYDILAEEVLYEHIICSMLNLMEDYNDTLDSAAQSSIEYFTELVNKAKNEIASGKAKSIYDR